MRLAAGRPLLPVHRESGCGWLHWLNAELPLEEGFAVVLCVLVYVLGVGGGGGGGRVRACV